MRPSNVAQGPPQKTSRPATAGGKFLTFFLCEEEYGVEILKVLEIIGMMPITPVPCASPSLRGVINLRGTVIPIMELRTKLGMPSAAPSPTSCIVITRASGILMGLMVDRVSDVLFIPPEEIVLLPPLGAGVESAYFLGIGKSQGKVRMLLDLDRVFASTRANPDEG